MSFGDTPTTSDKPGDWIYLQEDGDFKGVNIVVDSESKNVVSLSTKRCLDKERWNQSMPSLAAFPALETLDLENSRYVVALHDSVGSLHQMRLLNLRRCDRLVRLPESLGDTTNLQEVRYTGADHFVGRCQN
jgi:hypothetical protein